MANRTREAIVDSRVNKVLALRSDSGALLEALDSIGQFYTQNTVDARRSLRHDLENQNLALANQFIGEVEQISQRVQAVGTSAASLDASCSSLASHVADADTNMKSFMEKASELENKKSQYLQQAKEVESFLQRFQLTKQEIDTLYNANFDYRNSALEFFAAFNRLFKAYDDCKDMISSNRFSVAGVELMDRLSDHKDTAYRRLFEWVKGKCEGLASETTGGGAVSMLASDDVDLTLQMSIRYLKSLPIYYDQCVDLVVSARRTQLVQKFILALTQGAGAGSGGGARAIDLYAHDSARYIGDMLAWMHQTLVSEVEFLEAVFGAASGGHDSEAPVANGMSKMALDEILSHCLQGLGRPLRSRVMQTLENRHNSIDVLYASADLLCFYEATFSRLTKGENSMHSATKGCLRECKRIFVQSLNKQAASISATVGSQAESESFPVFLTKECAKQLRDVLKVFSSLLSTISVNEMIPVDKIEDDEGKPGGDNAEGEGDGTMVNECFIDNILGCIIQPILQAVRQSSRCQQSVDAAIFMLNNVSLLQMELKDGSNNTPACRAATKSWIDMLDVEVSTWVSVLVREETTRTLKRSDLDLIIELIDVMPASYIASEQPGMSDARISTVVKAFYSTVFTSVMLSSFVEKLVDPELRSSCRIRIANALATDYEVVHLFVQDPKNKYNADIILTHTMDEIKVLLGCSGTAPVESGTIVHNDGGASTSE